MTRAILVVCMLGACAKGGAASDDGGIDGPLSAHHDARPQNVTDATTVADARADATSAIDAAVAVDAALPPDASTSGNLCTSNAMCTDQGQCCVSINGVGFCANGVIIGATCLPQ